MEEIIVLIGISIILAYAIDRFIGGDEDEW